MKTSLDLIYKHRGGQVHRGGRTTLSAAKGQPVLIGKFTSVERLSSVAAATKRRILHNVLNRQVPRARGTIIAVVYTPRRRVTVATNMAGRGTDMKVGRQRRLSH